MRRQIQFWLDTQKRDERLLWQTICEWKARREFASKVREGLKLVYELSRGNVAYLFEAYPGLEDKIRREAGCGDDNGALQAKIDRLEQAILSLETGGYIMKPRLDPEPPLKVEKSTTGGEDAAANFLNSMLNI